jgi:hypothetical protein
MVALLRASVALCCFGSSKCGACSHTACCLRANVRPDCGYFWLLLLLLLRRRRRLLGWGW